MRDFLTGWGVRILIVAAIAGGAFLFRDRLTGDAASLAVGDCFDEPVGEEVIDDVQHHPCNESHNSEVIFVGNMTGANEAYPSEADVEAFVDQTCLPAYQAYLGAPFLPDGEVTVGWFYPTSEGWQGGDRGITCYAVRVDGAAVTQSFKAAP